MGFRFRNRRLHSERRAGFDWFTRSHKGTEGRLLQGGSGEWIAAAAGENGRADGRRNVECGMVDSDGVHRVDGDGRLAGAAFAVW